MPSSGDLPNPGIKPRSSALWVDSLPCEPPGKPKTTGVGSLFLLQGIFPTQDSNWGLLHCRWILYQLSYHGNSDKSIFLCKKQNKTKNLMEFQEEPKVFWFNLGLFYFYEKWMHLYLKGLSGCHYVQFVHPSSETFSWTIAFVCLLLRGVWLFLLTGKREERNHCCMYISKQSSSLTDSVVKTSISLQVGVSLKFSLREINQWFTLRKNN